MGMHGTVVGETKDKCWESFMKIDKEARGKYGLQRFSPENETEAYKEMTKNEETGKYELQYRFDN